MRGDVGTETAVDRKLRISAYLKEVGGGVK
jgi:hypothetical protein